MQLKQVSFRNNSIAKQNQQYNVMVSPVATGPTGDTVEISSKKKENKVLKYTLIGVGALLGIVAIVKHKNIAKIFEKAPEIKPDLKPPPKETSKPIGTASHHSVYNNSSHSQSSSSIQPSSKKAETSSAPSTSNLQTEASSSTIKVKNEVNTVQNTPSPLVPVEQIKKSWGQSYISEIDCKDGYQLWHFTSSEFFEKFVNAHKDLSEHFKKIALPGIYAPCDLDFIKTVVKKGNKAGLEFVKTIKEKTGVDLLGKITHYRFIGQSELDVIKAQKPVEPRYYGETFFTVNPRQGHSITTFDYRVTLKNTDNIVDNIAPYEPQQYSTSISVPYTYKDVEKVEKLVDGKWQEVEFLPKDAPHTITTKATEPAKSTADVKSQTAPQEREKPSPLLFRIKKLSDMEVRSLVEKSLDAEHKYKLSDGEKAAIQNKYGEYSKEYIENLCRPIDKDGFQFMTKFVNICDGKYAEYWRSNPDKLVLITNAGSLQNKIDKNLSEAEWDIIINSFKTLFDGKTDAKTIEAVVKYKGTDFDNVNGTIIHQNHLDKILKSLDKKESLSSQEIQKIKFQLKHLQDVLENQLFISDLSMKDYHKAIYQEFNDILNCLDKEKFNSKEINQLKNKLINFKNSIINVWKEKNIQDTTRFITELIINHGEKLDGIALNRVERSLKGSMLSTIEVDGQPLSELMIKAKTDENARSKISSYLNNNQPVLERDSFMSTSLPLVNAFHDNDVYWKLTPQKGVKGLYIEDAYDILRERKEGREAEVLIQRGSKIQIKKAELKNGIWELEGVISPAENL